MSNHQLLQSLSFLSINRKPSREKTFMLVIKSQHKRNMWICVGLKGQPLKKSSQFAGQSRSVVERKVLTSLGISILLTLRKRSNILLLTQRFSFSSLKNYFWRFLRSVIWCKMKFNVEIYTGNKFLFSNLKSLRVQPKQPRTLGKIYCFDSSTGQPSYL